MFQTTNQMTLCCTCHFANLTRYFRGRVTLILFIMLLQANFTEGFLNGGSPSQHGVSNGFNTNIIHSFGGVKGVPSLTSLPLIVQGGVLQL